MTKIAVVAASLLFALTGCSTVPLATPQVRLTVARGPCFGFCPVYEIRTIGPDRVEFSGIRHTAVLGQITKRVSREAVAETTGRLEAYRPTSTSSHFPCSNEVSDQALYTISWQAAGTAVASQLTFNSGCQTTEGRALKAILDDLPRKLDLETETRQITRPGTSRG